MPYPVPAGNVTINVNNHANVSIVSSVTSEWLLENCVSYQIRGSYILSNHVSFNVIISNPLNSACMIQTYFLGFAHLDVLVWLILQGIFQESKEVSEKFSVILINGYSFHTRNLAVIFAWFWSWCFWSIFFSRYDLPCFVWRFWPYHVGIHDIGLPWGMLSFSGMSNTASSVFPFLQTHLKS